VHQFEFLPAVVAAAAAASAAVRHVSILSILRFALGSVISSATVRASLARSRQCFGSLIGTLAMGLGA
jgi:hypothetical protein